MPGDDDDGDPERRRCLLARLGDVALVERLREGGCAGPDWLATRARLVDYCVPVLHDLVLKGELTRRTARLGRPVRLQPHELVELRDDRGERNSLVGDTVVAGVRMFRDVGILKRGWRADGEASLRTYAVNGCLMQCGDAVKRWRKKQSGELCAGAGSELDEGPAFARRQVPDPAEEVIARLWLEDLLTGVPEPLRTAIEMRVADDGARTWTDIARELGVDVRVIQRALSRLRVQHRSGAMGDRT